MNSVQVLGYDYATCYHGELIREANAQRLVAEARHNAHTVGGLRRGIGVALIRTGEHLQRIHDRSAAVDLNNSAGALHHAR